MSGWAVGPFGHGPWGGGVSNLGLVRNFIARNSHPNEITLTFKRPVSFGSDAEIVIVRRKDSFPMELYNDATIFLPYVDVSGFTDPAQVEIYRAFSIYGSGGVGSPNQLTDSGASFPNVIGRILRDSQSHNFRITANTGTILTVEGTPQSGQYVILPDFSNTNEPEITGIALTASIGFIRDPSKAFISGELINRVLVDNNDNRFIIRNNSSDVISVSGTPVVGNYTILQEFKDYTSPSIINKGQFSYIDTFLNKLEASARIGTGLESDQFYYYTAFTHRKGRGVAESVFALITDANSTQSVALSTLNRNFKDILLQLWPNIFKQVDITGDFADAMAVFGFGFNEIYSYVNTFDLSNPDKILYSVLSDQSLQLGISSADLSLGVDHQRRIVSDLLPTWKLKGTKQGIVDFIRIITTWDVTNGTGDASEIKDTIPNLHALRFFDGSLPENTRFFGFEPVFINDPNEDGSSPFIAYTYNGAFGTIQYAGAVDLSTVVIGDTFIDGAGNSFPILGVDDLNNKITIDTLQTVDTSKHGDIYKPTVLPSSGRFFKSASGVIIPGFFTFREFVVVIKDVALFTGESTNIEIIGNIQTRLTDTNKNFGGTDNLIGNFLLPKQGQTGEIFQIVSNTNTTITVNGVVSDLTAIGDYVVLSPLNAVRFQQILKLMNEFSPSFARAGFQFITT